MSCTSNINSGLLPQIPGYAILAQLYAGSRTSVYQSIESSTDRPVVIKLLQQDYPSFNDLVQFRNQYTITKNLNIPGIIRSYSLEPCNSSYALVMEDYGGISLRQYTQGHSLSLEEILAIAIQLTTTLHDLHQARVIHKDIKPANILIHPESKQIKLIDFSIASLLPKETQEIKNPNGLEGTLAYLAPEQTGRMNRAVDYRADFYALGVTLFELLAGQLPFSCSDPMELVHCHLAQRPPSLDQLRSEIPRVLSEIIGKLMSKNAEERYQSALGLQHDLQVCLGQLQATGQINPFAIARQDRSDHFLIPEKLYGRETEVDTLLNAFERVAKGSAELMLVGGFSGIGKTAVVNEVHKPITRQQGYFIRGKFDQLNRNIPFSAFVQAFRDLIEQLLAESDAQLQAWKTKILAVLGSNAQVILAVIPELEHIIGQQPSVPELLGTAAQNRFHLLFQKFIAVFTTPDHPVVMFLDDWQWADAASLQLLRLLMEDKRYLLLIGAYRDNEVSPSHPFLLTVEDLKKAGHTVHTLTLAPLALRDTNQLVADTLRCSTERSQPLTELIQRKTQGNPFFLTQFLKALHEDGQIRFVTVQSSLNEDALDQAVLDQAALEGGWECNISQVMALSLTEDVVEFMAQQLQKLPRETQQILQLAACIGNQFDLATLAIVAQQSETMIATVLWKALQEGVILPMNQTYKFFQAETANSPYLLLEFDPRSVQLTYRFLHDRIQQAAYSLIPDHRRQHTHLQIGRLLWQRAGEGDYLFEILNHLNESVSLVSDEQERRSLRDLNLMGCQRAKLSTAYGAAVEYASFAINLLPSNPWQVDPNFTLSLYEVAAEVAYLNTEFDRAAELIESILSHVQAPIDCIRSQELLVQIYIAKDQQLQAIETGLRALTQLGVPLVQRANWQETLPLLPEPTALATRPTMTNPVHLAALRILITITPPTHHVKPELFPAVVLSMVELCDREGYSELAAYAYGIYGLLLCALIEDPETAHRSGQLSLQLLEQFQARSLRTKVNMLFAVFVCAAKEAGRATLSLLKQGIEVGFEVGDIEYVSYCIMAYFSNLFLVGEPLETIDESRQIYISALEEFKQEHCIEYSKVWLEVTDQLTSISQADEAKELSTLEYFEATHNHQCLFAFHLSKLITCYTFENYPLGLDHAVKALASQEAAFGILLTAAHTFYYSLALLASVNSDLTSQQRADQLNQVAINQDKLAKLSLHAPSNYQHKFDLVAAEQSRLLGRNLEVIDLYDRAIAGANDNGYIQEAALANELAAKFYLSWGKEKIAQAYMIEAYYGYARWGAKAKVQALEASYPQLLDVILQQAQSTHFDPLATLLSVNPSTQASSTSLSDALDFAAVIKAAQTLSSEIELDELLKRLTQIILQNSGGEKCVLVLPQEETWRVSAISTCETTELCSTPLDHHPNVPVKLIQYVKRTHSLVEINDLQTNLPVIDHYLSQYQPKSILGLPILNQGNLVGILYVENQLTSDVFTRDRLTVIHFLCTQAAISLEHARLYQSSQIYSEKLEQALKNLQQAQLQMIQNEKMSALGNLIAGVAHEINNPIGFIAGNLKEVQKTVQDLVAHINLYRDHASTLVIADHEEEIDLDYSIKDLSKMIHSMQLGCDRVKSISTSLRTFSRSDTEQKVSANLHKGIESTLLILKYRLKANEYRPAIQIIQNYGDLPPIKCFPGQLNQVFMNIFANAIDMFDELAQGKSFSELRANPQTIEVRTTLEENQAKIYICDNGKGMTEDLKSRIFDHLFTTKAVGKGTGLGLAIAHQIVVDKHGGKIQVNSTPGTGTEFIICLPTHSS